MSEVTTCQKTALSFPPSLFVYSILYGGLVCIAGILGNKQISLGPLSELGTLFGIGSLAVESGIFAFLLLVTLSSAVAELHGRKIANKLVIVGFLPLVITIILSMIVLVAPAAPEMEQDRLAAFEMMMSGTPRIWLGGIIAYGISQMLNVTVFAALKGTVGGRLLWLRAGAASILSQIVDTFLFISISFYGVFPIGQLLAGQMLAKVTLSIIMVPPVIYLLVMLGRWMDRNPVRDR